MGNPISAILGLDDVEVIVPNEGLTLADAIQRFSLGQPVARSTLARLALSVAGLPPVVGAGKCFARALASPVFDDWPGHRVRRPEA